MTTVPPLTDETPLDQYTATASQTDFVFTFMIFATADILVYVNDVLKTETTDYIVKQSDLSTIVPADDLPMDGGKVVFNTGLTLSDRVTISRDIPVDRLTGYSTAGAFRADILNAELTRMQAISQQFERDLTRSIILSPSDDVGGSFVMPPDRASKFLAFDASSNLIAAAGSAGSVVTSTFMETVLDDATAAAARTTLGAQAADDDLTDIAALTVARGDVMIGDSTPEWSNLAVGTANQILTSDGTDTAWSSDATIGDLVISTKLKTAPNTATIATGAITYTGAYMVVDTEAAAATDDLDTISGGSDGDILIINSTSSLRDIVLTDNTGNIRISTGSDITLGSAEDRVVLQNNGTNWVVVARQLQTDFLSSKTLDGFTYLPNGILVQWGSALVPANSTLAVSYPLAYPNFTISRQATYNTTVNNIDNPCGIVGLSTTQLNLTNGSGAAATINWLTFGV